MNSQDLEIKPVNDIDKNKTISVPAQREVLSLMHKIVKYMNDDDLLKIHKMASEVVERLDAGLGGNHE